MSARAPLARSRDRTQADVPVIGSLFTGYGGLDLGAKVALGGGRIAWVADADRHVRTVLAARMPDVPNLGDIAAIPWQAVEPVDVITAGWPCQDISSAGKRAGIDHGTRSGLWRHVVTAVRTLRPSLLVGENVAALRWRGGGMHRVLADLTEAGYDCLWTSVRAADIGAAHRRERVFLLGFPHHDPTRAIALALAGTAQPSTYTASEPGTVGNVDGQQSHPTDPHRIHWGVYEPAIRRWETVLARPAPHPVEPRRAGRPVLSAEFVEWLMGLDKGYLTNLGLPRTALLRILGNGVVPQQATHALQTLLIHLATTELDHDTTPRYHELTTNGQAAHA